MGPCKFNEGHVSKAAAVRMAWRRLFRACNIRSVHDIRGWLLATNRCRAVLPLALRDSMVRILPLGCSRERRTSCCNRMHHDPDAVGASSRYTCTFSSNVTEDTEAAHGYNMLLFDPDGSYDKPLV